MPCRKHHAAPQHRGLDEFEKRLVQHCFEHVDACRKSSQIWMGRDVRNSWQAIDYMQACMSYVGISATPRHGSMWSMLPIANTTLGSVKHACDLRSLHRPKDSMNTCCQQSQAPIPHNSGKPPARQTSPAPSSESLPYPAAWRTARQVTCGKIHTQRRVSERGLSCSRDAVHQG